MNNATLNAFRGALQEVLGATPVYLGDLPELMDVCVALRPTDGYPSTMYFGTPDTLEPLLEVLIRSRDYATGTDVCSVAMRALDGFSDDTVGVVLSRVVGSPGYLGRDVNGFGEWHFVVRILQTAI